MFYSIKGTMNAYNVIVRLLKIPSVSFILLIDKSTDKALSWNPLS